MKRIIRIFIVLQIVQLTAAIELASAGVVYRDSCYSMRVSVGCAYNAVYEHSGTFDLDAMLPINKNFDGEINLRALTANSYALGLRMQPKFPLRKESKDYGEIQLETYLMYNAILRNRIHGFSAAFMVGYRWDYVHVKVGYGLSLFAVMDMSSNSTENGIVEPHNLAYYIELFTRPHTSPWNISVGMTDISECQMERMFTPTFMLNSYVSLSEQWRLHMGARCKIVGIANMAASFFGTEVKIGGEYKF